MVGPAQLLGNASRSSYMLAALQICATIENMFLRILPPPVAGDDPAGCPWGRLTQCGEAWTEKAEAQVLDSLRSLALHYIAAAGVFPVHRFPPTII